MPRFYNDAIAVWKALQKKSFEATIQPVSQEIHWTSALLNVWRENAKNILPPNLAAKNDDMHAAYTTLETHFKALNIMFEPSSICILPSSAGMKAAFEAADEVAKKDKKNGGERLAAGMTKISQGFVSWWDRVAKCARDAEKLLKQMESEDDDEDEMTAIENMILALRNSTSNVRPRYQQSALDFTRHGSMDSLAGRRARLE
ncbi:hypothetical protein N0V90_004688 [Kalmusia sp. IMI 367209]|nr:hypothetical protein N0V90_004688 [Kalmusia sp. IMI 367209]